MHWRASDKGKGALFQIHFYRNGAFEERLPASRQTNSPVLSIRVYPESAQAAIKGVGSAAGLSALTALRPGTGGRG